MKLKKLLTLLLIATMAFSSVACSSSSSSSSSTQEEVKNVEDMTKTEKVNYYITKGRDDYKSMEDDDKIADTAAQYLEDIREYVNSETQFDSDKNMEDIMYKGSFLEAYGKNKVEMFTNSGQEKSDGYKIAKAVYELGMDSVQMVKYVYREAETPKDDATIANIKQVKKSLQDFDNI